MREVVLTALQMPVVQTGIIAVVVFVIQLLAKRYKWAKTAASLAVNAYVFAEKEGLVQGLNGYAKFDPFMDKFVTQFNSTFGRDPSPAEKAIAVKHMEKLVQNELKAPVTAGNSSGVSG